MTELLAIAVTFFVLAATPGPACIAVGLVALRHGRREGLLFGTGLGVGLAFWGIVAATGLGAVLQASADLLFVLKLLGAAYLLWLAFQAGRSALSSRATETPDPPPPGQSFRRGLLLNLSNPKAVVAWIAVLSVGMGAASDIVFIGLATAVCILLGFLIYAGYALALSLPRVRQAYDRAASWIEGVGAVLMGAAGLSLAADAISRR